MASLESGGRQQVVELVLKLGAVLALAEVMQRLAVGVGESAAVSSEQAVGVEAEGGKFKIPSH